MDSSVEGGNNKFNVRMFFTYSMLTLIGLTWVSHVAAFGMGLMLIAEVQSGGQTESVHDGDLVKWIILDVINSAFIILTSGFGGTVILRKWMRGSDITQPTMRRKLILFSAFIINLVELAWGSVLIHNFNEKSINYNTKVYFLIMFAATVIKTLLLFIGSNWILFSCNIINKK